MATYTIKWMFVDGIPRKNPSSSTAEMAHALPVSTVNRMSRLTMKLLRSNALVFCFTLYNCKDWASVSLSDLRIPDSITDQVDHRAHDSLSIDDIRGSCQNVVGTGAEGAYYISESAAAH